MDGQKVSRTGSPSHGNGPSPIGLPIVISICVALLLIFAATLSYGATSSVYPQAPDSTDTSTPPTDEADIQDICGTAQELIDAKKPEQALELIGKIDGIPPASGTPGNAHCPVQRILAVKDIGEEQLAVPSASATATGLPAKAQESWDTFAKNALVPWQTLALTWLGVITALLVLARLLSFSPPPFMPYTRLPWIKSSKLIRRICFWTGIALIVGCFPLFEATREAYFADGSGFLWPASWLGLGILGSFLFGTSIASRSNMGLTVRDATGTANESKTSYLVGVLGDLAGSSPRGIEIPRGSDATGLNDVDLTATLTKGVLPALQKMVQTIFVATPWQVVVDAFSEDVVSVAITRNKWAVASATINRADPLLFPKSKEVAVGAEAANEDKAAVKPGGPNLYKMAAAMVTATLARNYQGYEGLCGATDWRSIGLLFLATTDYADLDLQQRQLLSTAMELDPNNLTADAALRNNIYRHSNQRSEMIAYSDWMSTAIAKCGSQPQKGYEGLSCRLRLTQLSVEMNLAALPSPADREKGSCTERTNRPDTNTLANELLTTLEASTKETEDLVKRMRPHAALIMATVMGKPFEDVMKDDQTKDAWKMWLQDAMTSVAPVVAYDAACYMARIFPEEAVSKGSKDPIEEAKERHLTSITDRLDIAKIDAELAKQALSDAELRSCADLHPQIKTYLDELAVSL